MKTFKSIVLLAAISLCGTALCAQNPESNKQVVRKFYETYGTRHDVEGCLPLFENALFRTVGNTSMPALDVQGFKQLGLDYLKAFPDLKMTVLQVIAEGDHVVAVTRFTGTQTGPLMTLPPSGKAVDVVGVDVWTVRNGKLAGLQAFNNDLQLLQQLGVIPPMK